MAANLPNGNGDSGLLCGTPSPIAGQTYTNFVSLTQTPKPELPPVFKNKMSECPTDFIQLELSNVIRGSMCKSSGLLLNTVELTGVYHLTGRLA